MGDTRIVALEGINNFRDYGDYAVVGGGRVRRGVLWRSGQHVGATDADLRARVNHPDAVHPDTPGLERSARPFEIANALTDDDFRKIGFRIFSTPVHDADLLAYGRALVAAQATLSLPAASNTDREAWIDRNVIGSPALIQAMKNIARDHETGDRGGETMHGAPH